MNHKYTNIQEQAKKHHNNHERLKFLINSYYKKKENLVYIFIISFLLALSSILIYKNWNNIIIKIDNYKTNKEIIREIDTNGSKTGVLSVYKINKESNQKHYNLLNNLFIIGSVKAAESNTVLSRINNNKIKEFNANTLKNTIWLNNTLSKGQHLSKLNQNKTYALQKSLISNYYFGEKTIKINSILKKDLKILDQIINTLSVDLFKYLNQSANRADTLDSYVNLLEKLKNMSEQRIKDLESQINFLTNNSKNSEKKVSNYENEFFKNINNLDSDKADENLNKFTNLEEKQVNTKAKLGAYKTIQYRYSYYLPYINNLLKSIKANRDPLIAGVKVVEIQNMMLDLIIKEK